MSSDTTTNIMNYAKKFNTAISDDDLLELVTDTVVDRVLLYLNDAVLDSSLERTVAQIVVGVYNQTNTNIENAGVDQAVSSVSDNGQSVSYANEVKNYLATADDSALFGGFAQLLARYRSVDVPTV